MNRTEFRDQMAIRLSRCLPELAVTLDPRNELVINLAMPAGHDPNHLVLHLGNAYRRVTEKGDFAWDGVTEELVATALRAMNAPKETSSWQNVRGLLAMQLRPLPELKVPSGQECHVVAAPSPFLPLSLCVYLDSPESLLLVHSRYLLEWGVTEGTVIEIAERQTLSHLPEWRKLEPVQGRTIYLAADSDGYACSSIAFPEHVERLGIPRERLWLAAPGRDEAIAFEGGSPDDDPFVRGMAHFIRDRYRRIHHPISPCLYRQRVCGAVEILGALGLKGEVTS